jgi:hypothetical protein
VRVTSALLLHKIMNAKIAGLAGMVELKTWSMVNIKIMNKLKLEIQILLMKYRHLLTPELEQKFDELHDEIESDEE